MCDTSSYFLLILSFVERQQFYHFVRGYLCAKYPLTNPMEPPQTAVCLMSCIYYVFAIVLRTTSCLCPRTSHMALRHPCLRCFSFNPDRNYVNNGVRACFLNISKVFRYQSDAAFIKYIVGSEHIFFIQ